MSTFDRRGWRIFEDLQQVRDGLRNSWIAGEGAPVPPGHPNVGQTNHGFDVTFGVDFGTGAVLFPVGPQGLQRPRPIIGPSRVPPAPREVVRPLPIPIDGQPVPGTPQTREPVLVETPEGDFTQGSDIYIDVPPTDWERVEEEYDVLNPEPEGQRPELDETVDEDPERVPTVRIPTPVSPPVLIEEIPQEEEEMAIDWGDVIGGTLGTIGRQLAGGPQQPYSYSGPVAPRQVTVDTVTGRVTPCRRRRRRRLLTPTDLSDLAALASIVGKGDALKLAVTKAVRR